MNPAPDTAPFPHGVRDLMPPPIAALDVQAFGIFESANVTSAGMICGSFCTTERRVALHAQSERVDIFAINFDGDSK
jgi:hypothetical protein